MRKQLQVRAYACLIIYSLVIARVNLCYVVTYDSGAIRSALGVDAAGVGKARHECFRQGLGVRAQIFVAPCRWLLISPYFVAREANHGLRDSTTYNARFSSFPMYHAAFLFSIGPPSRLIFCDPARPAQELGRIDVAHRCGRHSAAQVSDRARGRNVLHHPRLRCCPGNGVRREGAVDETYHAKCFVFQEWKQPNGAEVAK